MARATGNSALDRLPPAGKFAFGAVLIAVLFAAYFVVFYGDLASAIKQAESEEATLHQKLGTAKEALAAYNKDLQEKAQLELRARDLKKVLPESSEAPAFLSAIQGVATLSGVTLKSWTPMEESPQEFYAKIPMRLTLSGKFHQLARFFYAVGQLDRIINIENITLKEPKMGEDSVDVQAECLATAFRSLRNPDEGRKAKAPAAAKKGGK